MTGENMSEKSERKLLSFFLRGKGILNPCKTGIIDEHVRCVREYGVNIFFYTKNNKTIMIDTGYLTYPKLSDKLKSINIDASQIRDILMTHADPDHAGGIDDDSDRLFSGASIYISDIENLYFEKKAKRKLLHVKPIRHPKISNQKHIVKDKQIFSIGDIKVQCFITPGHTLGLMCYLIDDKYFFTGDCIALSPDGGYNFMWFLNANTKRNTESVKRLKELIKPYPIVKAYTSHTGVTSDLDFLFKHIDINRKIIFGRGTYNDNAPYDLYAKEE